MATIKMIRENAEADLLELMRGEDSPDFILTVTTDNGKWTVTIEDHNSGSKAVGHGESFAEAWFSQKPSWAGTSST